MRLFWSKSKEYLELPLKVLKPDYWVFMIKRRPWVRKFLWATAGLIFLFIASIGAGIWYMYKYEGCVFDLGCLTDDSGKPLDMEKLARSDFKRASYIYDKDNAETGKFFDEIRDPVRLEEVPEVVRKAFIAAEDKRFYDHSGIDLQAIISAAIGNVTRKLGWKVWARSGGASTITQQLARLRYASDVKDFKDRSRTLGRKLKEARLAIQLERKYSKDKILEEFLNEIWLGHGANGVASAYRRYFGKDIRKDKPATLEAAILAGLNKNPALYDPISHAPAEPEIEPGTTPEIESKLREEYKAELIAEGARQALVADRINFVLGQMRDMGAISRTEYESNRIKRDENSGTELARLRPWKNRKFEYGNRTVKVFLLSQGYSEEELSKTDGLRIYTTIDSEIQDIATEEFEKHLAAINTADNLTGNKRIDGAFIIIEVATGNILALSGGHDFNETQYNRVFATRSPGSGFKPLVYAAALEQGMDYFDKVCNCPITKIGGDGKLWSPQNFPDKNPRRNGYIDMAEGPIWSLNLLTLNLAQKIGMEAVMKMTHDLGVYGNPGIVRDSDGEIWFRKPGYEIRGGIEPTLPSAIGAAGVNLIELANAYTVFYRNGRYVRPTLIKEIRGTYGNLLFKTEKPEEKQVMSEENAAKMLGLMRAVTKIGTAKISMKDIEQQVACKTGTSNGPKDVSIWCGTPEIFIGIRLGHDDYKDNIEVPNYMQKISGDREMLPTGGWLVGRIARDMIDRTYKNREKVPFSEKVESNKQLLLDRYQN